MVSQVEIVFLLEKRNVHNALIISAFVKVRFTVYLLGNFQYYGRSRRALPSSLSQPGISFNIDPYDR